MNSLSLSHFLSPYVRMSPACTNLAPSHLQQHHGPHQQGPLFFQVSLVYLDVGIIKKISGDTFSLFLMSQVKSCCDTCNLSLCVWWWPSGLVFIHSHFWGPSTFILMIFCHVWLFNNILFFRNNLFRLSNVNIGLKTFFFISKILMKGNQKKKKSTFLLKKCVCFL